MTRVVTMFHAVAVPTIAPFAHDAIHSHASPAVDAGWCSRARLRGEFVRVGGIANSGAGRSLASHQALSAQGIFLDEWLRRDDETIVFETGVVMMNPLCLKPEMGEQLAVLCCTQQGVCFVTRDRTCCLTVRLCGPWAKSSNQANPSYGCQIGFRCFCNARMVSILLGCIKGAWSAQGRRPRPHTP